MNFPEIVAEYVAYKKALGMRFLTEDHILASCSRFLGDVPITSVTAQQMRAYLDGHTPLSSYWQRKHVALKGLFRFALARGYLTTSPLPLRCPRVPPPLVPYIYSQAELKRLLDATPAVCGRRVSFDADVFRNLLLLLYGACLRPSEGRHLAVKDVDLGQAVLCIQASKFYKTRQVPMGKDLTAALGSYLQRRSRAQETAPVFCCRDGRPLSKATVGSAFRRLRKVANIQRQDGARYQPRLHDLRHTGVVHRLLAWYQSGADLQRRLPQLATYLGHVDLTATQHYLTLTPELLQAASQRFEHYAMETSHD